MLIVRYKYKVHKVHKVRSKQEMIWACTIGMKAEMSPPAPGNPIQSKIPLNNVFFDPSSQYQKNWKGNRKIDTNKLLYFVIVGLRTDKIYQII